MQIEIQWNRPLEDIVNNADGGNQALLFLANEMKRIMDPYVPARNLILAQNVRTYVEDGHGVVHYMSSHAHYQYEGKQYVDPVTGKGAFTDGMGQFWSRPGVAKQPTGRPLNYSKARHPLATHHWDKAAKTARFDEVLTAYQNRLRG